MSNQFLNVYNFIPLPKKKAKKYEESDRHTGYIEYQITTKTPLFIPNTSNEDYFNIKVDGHKSYDFFSYTNLANDKSGKCHQPVIPGSQMRGMIRSIYETVTASCLSKLNTENELSKRVISTYEAGLLHKVGDHYELYYADSYIVEGAEEFKDGEKVNFDKKGGTALIKKDGKREGYIFRGEFDPKGELKKYKYHVYAIGDPENDLVFDNFEREDVQERMSVTIDSYKAQKDNAKEIYDNYEKEFYNFLDGYDKNGDPVEDYFPVNYHWVNDDDGELYLSCARITREVSRNVIKDMVRDFNPCCNQEDLCPSCDLFGTVNTDRESELALTSKLRFADLEVEDKEKIEDYFMKVVTLPALSSPKLSNTAFYFKKPAANAAFWTYDYYVANNQEHSKIAEIQGRKYYWHFKQPFALGLEPSILNKTIRPLKEGITFTGKVYFDGISKKQLEQLKLILSGFDGQCSYKLGTGKPLGMGSIDCKVKEIKERINFKDGHPCFEEETVSLKTKSYEEVGFDLQVEAPFKLICDFNACEGLEVSYPQTTNPEDEGFEWYKMDLKKPEKIKFHNYLKPLAKGKSAKDFMLGKDGLGGKSK